MHSPWQKTSWKSRSLAFPVIFFVLVSCVITAGCLEQVIIPVFTPSAHTHLADNEGNLSVFFLDVGQGDSTLFVIDGKTILIDAGEIDRGDRVVSDVKKLGLTRIDLLVATHPHSDHIGGMEKVLAAFPVGRVLDSGLPSTSSIYEHFLRIIEKNNISYQVAEQGQVIDVDPALHILVLSPPAQRSGEDLNNNSVVLRISYKTIDFLMTGDLGGEGEEALFKSGYPLDAEILKVGHHGSFSSTSSSFLARVHPESAIISAGVDNPYGHPHQQTLDRLQAAGVTVYRTDFDGTIMVRSDGLSYSVNTESDDQTIWTTVLPSRQTTIIETTTALPVFTLLTMTIPPVPANLTLPVSGVTLPQIGNASSVYISATRFDAPGDDRVNLNNEWVQLTNRGDGPVLLAGWTLTDTTGLQPYVFPAFILVPGSSVTVCTGSGMMNDTVLFMGKNEPLWGNNGDMAILKDSGGNIIDKKS